MPVALQIDESLPAAHGAAGSLRFMAQGAARGAARGKIAPLQIRFFVVYLYNTVTHGREGVRAWSP